MGLGIKRQVRREGSRQIVDEIHKVVVHQFRVGDVDDPEIYAAEPIWKWQQTDAGKFVMKNSISTPSYHQQLDHLSHGYRYAITAELEKKKLSEFYLRWGKPNGNR